MNKTLDSAPASTAVGTLLNTPRRRIAAVLGAILIPVSIAIGVAVVVSSGSDSGTADTAAEGRVPVEGAQVIDMTGAAPDEVVELVVGELLGENLTVEAAEVVVGSLADLLGVDGASASGEDANDIIINALVRRLDLDPNKDYSLDELLELVAAEIDPDGLIDSPEALLEAVASWAGSKPANALRLVPPGQADGLLAGLESASFDDATAVLDRLELAAETLDVPFNGVDGLEEITIHRVSWDIDRATNSITFTGDAGSLIDTSATTKGLLGVLWGTDNTPDLVAGVHTSNWSLDTVGVTGELGDHELGDLTFVLSSSDERLAGDRLPPLARSFMEANYSADFSELSLESGINVLARLPLTALPDRAVEELGLGNDDRVVELSGFIGADFGTLTGQRSGGTKYGLHASLPPFDPPSFPEWIGLSPDDRWDLTIEGAGNDFEISLAGVVEARVDGTHPFAATMALGQSSDDGSFVLEGQLQEPWTTPFDVDWLNLEDVTMAIELREDASTARFAAAAEIAGRTATLAFEVTSADAGVSSDLTATLERLTATEVVNFISDKLGATRPADVPDFSLRDIEFQIQTGGAGSIAVAATADVAGGEADVVLAAVDAPTGTAPAVIIGVRIGTWNLGDLSDSLQGTVLGELQFLPSAFVASSLSGTVNRADMPPLVNDFFGEFAATSSPSFKLQSGVSVFSGVSLVGTSFDAPLQALGASDPALTVVGTIPGQAFGLGGGGGLDDLSLTIGLPEIRPATGPEWLESGQLSLRVTGRSVGIEGRLGVNIDDESLTFVVRGDVQVDRGVSFVLSGELETVRPWVAPFDQQWLTINGAAIELEVAATGKVGLGVAGSVIIGEKDLDMAMKLEVLNGVPVNFGARFSSEAGISTNDLIKFHQRLQGGAVIDTSAYPSIALRNIDFQFALKASEALGFEQAGFKLKGDAWVAIGGGPETLFAAVDVDVSVAGISATGSMGSYQLGPLEFGSTELRLVLTTSEQSFTFDSEVILFGIGNDVEIELTKDSIFFNGSDVLERLSTIIDAFKAAANDPAGSLDQVQAMLDGAGVSPQPWLTELLDAVKLISGGSGSPSAGMIDTVLAGGSVAAELGGSDPFCAGLLSERNGRCYDRPAILHVVPSLGPGRCNFIGTHEAGQCWILPPSKASPAGGYPMSCSGVLFDLTFENGQCWRVPPSARTVPGLCKTFDIPCSLRELFDGKIAGLLADAVARAQNWG